MKKEINSELLQEYRNWLVERNEKPGTISIRITAIKRYLTYRTECSITTFIIDERAVKNYLNYLRRVIGSDGRTQFSAESIKNSKYILRSFSNFLVETNRMEPTSFSHPSEYKISISSKYS